MISAQLNHWEEHGYGWWAITPRPDLQYQMNLIGWGGLQWLPETEETEVAIHRDLARVSSNRIRGGMCLVIAEGVAQKSRRVMGHAEKLGLDWSWLGSLTRGPKKSDEEKPKAKAKGAG